MKAKTIYPTRCLTEAEKLDARLMRELHFLVKAANAETDLQMRLDQLYRASDVLESYLCIMPELDSRATRPTNSAP
jgi:hypothetical protein